MSKANEVSRRHFVASALSTAALAALPTRSIADAETQQVKGNAMTSLIKHVPSIDGQCQQAMEFYKACYQMPAAQQEKVLNAHLRSGNLEISASDWLALFISA